MSVVPPSGRTAPHEATPPKTAIAGDVAPLDALERLVEFVATRRCVVLSGAGCSTESGIPDYRGRGRPVSGQPIQHHAFVTDQAVQRRYWARATMGWERFSRAHPNPAHRALAALEHDGYVQGIITQNVDRLHQAAGSRRVVELHGALAEVTCLACGAGEPRPEVHARLLQENPAWVERHAELSADGDALLEEESATSFRMVACRQCGGALRPNVVFFGGSVSAEVVASAWQLIDECDAVLVVGSSLTVFSGFRFVRGAAARGYPIAIVNEGPTRADALDITLRVHARAGELLPQVVANLRG